MPTDIPAGKPAGGPDVAGFQRAIVTALHEHWKLYLAEGVALVILGLIAIVIPPLATLSCHDLLRLAVYRSAASSG